MANTVQIELQVDSQGAVQGVRSFDTAIKGGTGSVKQLGVELQGAGAKAQAAATQLSSAANSVEAFMGRAKAATAAYNAQAARGIEVQKQLGAAFDAAMVQGKTFVEAQEAATAAVAAYVPVAKAAAKANYSMGESYGVARVAAAASYGSVGGMASGLARLAASSKLLGPLLEAAMPIALAVGMVGILADMGEKVYNLYEKYISLDAAAEAYQKTVQKSQTQDFGNTRSIEDTRLRIDEARKSAQAMLELARQTNDMGWGRLLSGDIGGGIGMLAGAPGFAKEAFKQSGEVDKLRKQESIQQQHKLNLQQIEYNHALDGSLQGVAKINAGLARQREQNAENRRFNKQEDAFWGNPVSSNSGAADEALKNGIAQREADAQTFNLRREQSQEIARLHEQALESGLRGEALYQQRMEYAIEELKEKQIAGDEAVNDVRTLYHNQEMQRLHEEEAAVAKRARAAGGAGLTGIAKIQYAGQTRDQAILGDVANHKYHSLADAQQDRVSNQQQTNAEMLQQERSFADAVNRISDASATHQISGFARIAAEERKQLDDLQARFDKTYKRANLSDPNVAPLYKRDSALLAQGKSAIEQGAGDQRNELATRNADQTAAIEAAANEKSLSAEKQKTAAIQAEYEARFAKYNEELQQQEISQDDFNRRVAAAAEERDAEMTAAAKQAHDKMARQFSGFFEGMDHPLKYLARAGDKVAGNAAASLVQHFQSGNSTSQGVGGFFHSVFPGFGKKKSADAVAEMPGHAAHATSSVFSVGTAQISVGSAQISFGGGMASGGRGTSGAAGSPTTATFSYNGATGKTSSYVGASSSGGSGFSGGGSGDIGVNLPAQTYAEVGMGGSAGTGSTGTIGGAGDSSSADAPARSAIGAMQAKGGGLATAAANAQSGVDLYKQTQSTFGLGFGKAGASMNTTTSDLNGWKIGSDGTAQKGGLSGFVGAHGGQIESGAEGALGVYSAFEGNGGVGGALKGAMGGMQLGEAVAGPLGAAIGAGAGAIIGAIGFGGREKARVYDLKQVRPRITADNDAYHQGSMDYLSAYADMQSLMNEAKHTTSKMGPAAGSYYQDTIKKEILTAEQNFTAQQRAGRSMYASTKASYAVGTDSVPDTGMALVHEGERIIPAEQNRQITQALSVRSSYQAAMRASTQRQQRMGGGETNIHLNAIDAKSSHRWLMDNKSSLRSALNASLADNSGGSDL